MVPIKHKPLIYHFQKTIELSSHPLITLLNLVIKQVWVKYVAILTRFFNILTTFLLAKQGFLPNQALANAKSISNLIVRLDLFKSNGIHESPLHIPNINLIFLDKSMTSANLNIYFSWSPSRKYGPPGRISLQKERLLWPFFVFFGSVVSLNSSYNSFV